MWGRLSRLFARPELEGGAPADGMDQPDRQAKQRASVKWLLSKAFNNQVPENLKEPFYRDHENQEHLKPQIVGSLANAELYCLSLGNIYSDPNYHNLNHWAILQALSRKGVYVDEPQDAQLTETTLIQTNPLRMSAHMAVIEALMVLYAKEVVTSDRVLAAINRFNHSSSSNSHEDEHQQKKILAAPLEDHEKGLLAWVAHATTALQRRINQEQKMAGGEGDHSRPPDLPSVRSFQDLCDGASLAALIAFYCPDDLAWQQLQVSAVPTVPEALYNLGLVRAFCQRALPASPFHLQPEDVAYMRGSMKQNLIVFLADLFNFLEIHPAKCVRYPGMDRAAQECHPARNEQGVAPRRGLPAPSPTAIIPDLRSGIDDPPPNIHNTNTNNALPFTVTRTTPPHLTARKTFSEPSEFHPNLGNIESGEQFVVHRNKGVPTLSSVEPSPARPIRQQQQSVKGGDRGDERAEQAAGKPSNWDESRKSSFAGRRSRRNSVSDESQLTIENFGGSQEHLNLIGRNPDKELTVHIGRKDASNPVMVNNAPQRSSLQDARGSIQLGYDDNNGYDDGRKKEDVKRQQQQHQQFEANPAVRSSKQDAKGSINFGYDDPPPPASPPIANPIEKRPSSAAAAVNIANDGISLKNILQATTTNEKMMPNFADLTKPSCLTDPLKNNPIQLVYMNHHNEEDMMKPANLKSSFKATTNGDSKKTTTFAALPMNPINTTTWQQQQQQQMISSNDEEQHQQQQSSSSSSSSSNHNQLIASQLNDIRLQLEERRRHIEKEKRRMELAIGRQRERVGKAAFLQAVVTKGNKGSLVKPSPDSETESPPPPLRPAEAAAKPVARPVNLKDISDDLSSVEKRWFSNNSSSGGGGGAAPFVETRRTPDLDNMDIEQYQQSLAQMNSSLHDLELDIQRLASQQSQIQQQQHFNAFTSNPTSNLHQSYHLNNATTVKSQPQPPQQQFYLHDQTTTASSPPPQPPQRRTWSQQQQQQQQKQPELRTWSNTSNRQQQQSSGGFILHQNGGDSQQQHQHFTLSQQHFNTNNNNTPQRLQHQHQHQQQQQHHRSVVSPSIDDMAPQNISFIGNPQQKEVEADEGLLLSANLSRLNISSGTRTYRIPSPTRPLISRANFHQLQQQQQQQQQMQQMEDEQSEKGFYISFDSDDQPKRPKPPLRLKRGSPKKERTDIAGHPSHLLDDLVVDSSLSPAPKPPSRSERHKEIERELERERMRQEEREAERRRLLNREVLRNSQERETAAILVGGDAASLDPNSVDEMERKKEKIMLLSLQRRQQQEEAKARKEAEAQARRERDKAKEEAKLAKKEEQAARRAAILEQHKLKKAIEEAEREGKVLDKSELLSTLGKAAGPARLRGKTTPRPRPKTIHVDSGSVEMAEGMMLLQQPSRGKKGSTSNLTASNNYAPSSSSSSTMKRDYYRGSQDSLADRGLMGSLVYKGSSSEQDSMACLYRYGDTDSGLGRATPPRRAASPGMRHHHLLPSPSSSSTSPNAGPGSLPLGGLSGSRRHHHHQRMFDDGSSDISSQASSMMDYNGPRLYKQPTTKSNRGIMLNAVEYCVFPGVVNREAKRRVLEEMHRSEGKHFLILFRDAGCQFRALYSYCPEERDDGGEVVKLYGTGPRLVTDNMFDKFFKYNSGGKCFSQVHTKHLTVTIDAFTIHNSLWQGKKVNLPNKKDMALVI